MATPLRKDQPQFEEEKITTADLAQGKRPATETRGPQPLTGERPAGPNATQPLPTDRGASPSGLTATEQTSAGPLFPSGELDGLRTRWKTIQGTFVDEPRQAVELADELVASAMKRLAEVFSEERSRLEQQWDRGDNVSTEDLRVALQRYRTFFERMLSV